MRKLVTRRRLRGVINGTEGKGKGVCVEGVEQGTLFVDENLTNQLSSTVPKRTRRRLHAPLLQVWQGGPPARDAD